MVSVKQHCEGHLNLRKSTRARACSLALYVYNPRRTPWTPSSHPTPHLVGLPSVSVLYLVDKLRLLVYLVDKLRLLMPPTPFRRSGAEARQMEEALGIPVLRHVDKKPGGGSAELEAHFGCPVSDLIMVGDR